MARTLEKLPGETRQFCVDFSHKLRKGEVVTALEQVQVEPHPLDIDPEEFAVNGPKAFLTIGPGGVVDQLYVLVVRASTNGNRVIEFPCRLRIVRPAADLVIVRGDDYEAADGRQFQFQGGEEWPELTEADPVTLTLKSPLLSIEKSFAGTIEQATGSVKTVWFELGDEETSTLTPGGYRYDVAATIDGLKHTLRTGFAIVVQDQG